MIASTRIVLYNAPEKIIGNGPSGAYGLKRYYKDCGRRGISSRWGKKNLDSRAWPKLFKFAFIFSTGHLLLNLCHHYPYDILRVESSRLVLKNNFTIQERFITKDNLTQYFANSSKVVDERKKEALSEYVELKSKQSEYCEILRLLGSLNTKDRFLIECIYAICLFLAYNTYFVPQLMRLVDLRFDNYVSRILFDYADEVERSKILVHEEVEKFIASSRNYRDVLCDIYEKICWPNIPTFDSPRAAHPWPQDADLERLNLAHPSRKGCIGETNLRTPLASPQIRYTSHCPAERSNKRYVRDGLDEYLCNLLLQWQCANLLMPANRLPNWILGWNRMLLLYLVSCAIYATAFNFGILAAVLDLEAFDGRPAACLTIICTWVILFSINISTTGIGGAFAFTCGDQLNYCTEVMDNFRFTIDKNSERFREFIDGEEGSFIQRKLFIEAGELPVIHALDGEKLGFSLREQMNAHMLYSLMHYKIFVSQFKLLGPGFSVTLASGLIILFSYPILCRLHTPYFDSSDEANHRFTLVIVSLSYVPPCFACLVIICFLHKRCLKLYGALASLMAHMTKANHLVRYLGDEAIYSRHLVGVMRKEISHSTRMSHEFSIKSIGVRCTFSSVMKIGFWFGFVVISLVFKSTSDSNGLPFSGLAFGVI